MAEEKTISITAGGRTAEVPIDKQGNPQTLKYLGTDQHTRKYMEGKLFSNVAPPKSDYTIVPKENWICPECGRENRGYMARCWTSGCEVRR